MEQKTNKRKPQGKHKPIWGTKPVKVYDNALLKSQILRDFKGKTVIYQWFNNITGESYIGSALDFTKRMGKYYNPKNLSLNTSLIYASINLYGHEAFSLAILEVLGTTNSVPKSFILDREQYYLNCIFNHYGNLCLNILRIAGSSQGYKHTLLFLCRYKKLAKPITVR